MKLIRNVVAGTLLAGGALLTAAASFGIADAQTATTTTAPSNPHGWGPGRIYGKLGLTAEQQASINAIFTAAKPQMQSLHQQMKANHLKLTETSPDDPNYASVVQEVSAANATLAAQRTTASENVRAQIHALLTPAQKTQLAALQAQWAANPHHGRWHGQSGAPTAAPAAQ
jgi:Spy/CpxP family protein refolding chaperone